MVVGSSGKTLAQLLNLSDGKYETTLTFVDLDGDGALSVTGESQTAFYVPISYQTEPIVVSNNGVRFVDLDGDRQLNCLEGELDER